MRTVLVCRETDPRETRVALIPDDIKKLIGMGFSCKVVRGAGVKSGFLDAAYEKAGAVMAELMPYVDVCIANEEDAKDVFGIAAENSDVNTGKLDREGYVSVARQLSERFGFKAAAITLRGSISASENNWSGMLYADGKAYFARNYLIHLVDRVGGGDSFGGGLIHAMRKWPEDSQGQIEFAVAASCLKQATEFDFNLASEGEVLALAGGNASGRVQR